jgi:hypothetical protein
MGRTSVRQCKGGEDCRQEDRLCRIAVKKDTERVPKVVKGAACLQGVADEARQSGK